MPIDFTTPTTLQLRTAYASSLRDSLTALAQWLDPAVAGTLTSTPTGAYRLNSGALQRFNGTSWVAQAINGVNFDGTNLSIGGTSVGDRLGLTGTAALLRLANDGAYISFFDSANLARSGYLQIHAAATSVLMVEANRALAFGTNAVSRLFIEATGNTVPAASNAYTLGSSSLRWSNVFGVSGNFSGEVSVSRSPGASEALGTVTFYDAASARTGQMIRTGSSYSYAGVGASSLWLYEGGDGTIAIGPDGNGSVRFVAAGAIRANVNSAGLQVTGALSASGAVTAATVQASAQPGFAARRTSAQTSGNDITFDVEDFDVGAAFNPATGVFTAPATGRYMVSGVVLFRNLTGSSQLFQVSIFKNGAGVQVAGQANLPTVTTESRSFAVPLSLAAGDQIKLNSPFTFTSSYGVGIDTAFSATLIL